VTGGRQLTPDELAALEDQLRQALAPTYVLLQRIGAGGMGSVYLARQPALKRLVAAKVLSPDLTAAPEARARFEREAQAVAGLSHPNVVSIYGVGELSDGTPYFVMQYVSGKSMAARVEEEGPLPADEARRIIGQVASALAAAHRQGIIHRDIKPANVLYDEESGRAMVSDFGIAAVRRKGDGRDATKLTQTGMAVGTPRYMSPEQLLAEEVTDKTDMYALGLLGYELLAGDGPFTATAPQELIAQHLRDTPKKLSEIRDDLDPELESLITACLSKKPEDRPSSEEVARRLEGTAALLEWPPPGLEPLHGRLPQLTRWYGMGSVLVAGATLWMIAAGPRMSAVTISLGSLVLLLGAILGLVTLGAAWSSSVLAARAMARAVRAGFGWYTVLETMADRRRDSGLLIAGMREYAALSAPERSALRRWRLGRETTLLAAAALPAPLLLASVWFGSWGMITPQTVPWLVLGPSVVLALVSASLARREQRSVGAARRRIERRATRREAEAAELVEPWNTAFEAVRRGQALGRGPERRPAPGIAAATAVILGTLLSVVIVSPLGLVGTIGPVLWQAMTPQHQNTLDKYQIAESTRPWAAPKDSSIDPTEAGRAWYSVVSAGGDPAGRPLENPVPYPLPPWLPEPGPFADTGFAPGPGAPNPSTIVLRAGQRFSPAERAYLAQLARHPGWQHVGMVARAPAVDLLGARFTLPLADSIAWLNLPVPPVSGTKAMAYAAAGRVAHLLSEGREREAEQSARETIGFGFSMADEALTLIDGLLGVVIVGIAQQELQQLYELTGNPEGERVRAAREAAVAARDAAVAAGAGPESRTPGAQFDPVVVRQDIARVVRSRQLPRSIRVEALGTLGLAPCTNVRELIFGPDPELTALFAEAKRTLARFPSEQALIEMFRTAPERGFHADPRLPRRNWAARLGIGAAHVAGFLLRNERLPGCVEIAQSLGEVL
jgi:hypothetical protein